MPTVWRETADEEWNCAACRMNLYWASQHYGDLTGIRQRQGLSNAADTPAFLREAHQCAMNAGQRRAARRAGRGWRPIARKGGTAQRAKRLGGP